MAAKSDVRQTTVPFFSIDVDRLRAFLEDANDSRVGPVLRAPPPPLNRSPGPAGAPNRSSSFVSTPNNLSVRLLQVGSGGWSPQNRRIRFLFECELQVRKLFNFLEKHVSKAEGDLAVLFRLQGTGGSASHQGSIQLEESGSHGGQDAARINVSRLRHLRDVLLNLQVTLRSSFEGLEELAKAYDRGSNTSHGRAFLGAKSQRKEDLEARIEACLMKVNVWHAKRMSQARIPYLDSAGLNEVKNEKVDYLVGLHLMLFLALSTVTVYLYFWDSTSTWVVFFRTIRSPLLLSLYLYLLAVNMKVWAKARIDYPSIFDFPENGVATPNYVLGVAALFTGLCALAVTSFLLVSPFTFVIPGKVIPLVLWLSLLVFLINPFSECLHDGRRAFASTFLRILISPLTESRFGEVWLAIQLNSLGVVLLDLEYTICYAVQGPWTGEVDPRICTGSENAVRPLIASLPPLLQMLQNLRLFAERRQWKFLLNAIKFLTSFPIIIFATLFSINLPDTPHFHLQQILGDTELEWLGGTWLIFALLNGGYAVTWDVYFDWGLCHVSKRPARLYKRRTVYYLAVIIDLVFRSFWALEVTLALVWRYNTYTDLIYTGLVVGEILRNFVWNFFRLENQQVLQMVAEQRGFTQLSITEQSA